MVYNKIQVAFGALKKINGPPLQWQYNEKQYLIIKGLNLPEVYAVDFMNQGDTETITMVPTSEGVLIPDQFLQDGRPLIAYIVVVDGESVNTIGQITFPVNVRSRRTDISPEPVEQQQIDELVAALNNGVEKSEAASEAIQNMSVSASTLPEGSDASVEKSVNPETGAVSLSFGIPAGATGPAGPAGVIQSVNGKSGASITLDSGDIEFDDSVTYAAGSIGAEVSQQKNAISQKQDAPSSAGTAGQVLGLDSNLNPAWMDQTGGGGGMNIVNLSGTQITQVGADNTFYVCGELTELTFTAPSVGITMIRFTSGTTPTVCTINGVTSWMYGFDPTTDIEASKTYDINVLNGIGVAGWA